MPHLPLMHNDVQVKMMPIHMCVNTAFLEISEALGARSALELLHRVTRICTVEITGLHPGKALRQALPSRSHQLNLPYLCDWAYVVVDFPYQLCHAMSCPLPFCTTFPVPAWICPM